MGSAISRLLRCTNAKRARNVNAKTHSTPVHRQRCIQNWRHALGRNSRRATASMHWASPSMAILVPNNFRHGLLGKNVLESVGVSMDDDVHPCPYLKYTILYSYNRMPKVVGTLMRQKFERKFYPMFVGKKSELLVSFYL